jgi:hypothetical protein
VEIRALNVEVSHVLVRHDDSLRIGFVVEFASNRQAGSGGRGADQFDDDAIAEQRFGPPILGDEREQAMLDLVPFTVGTEPIQLFSDEPLGGADGTSHDLLGWTAPDGINVPRPRDASTSRSLQGANRRGDFAIAHSIDVTHIDNFPEQMRHHLDRRL